MTGKTGGQCDRVTDVVHGEPLRAESLHQVQRRELVADSGIKVEVHLLFRSFIYYLGDEGVGLRVC